MAPRHRFVITIDGATKEIMSAFQNKGEVRILLKHAQYYEDGPLEIKNEYYSLHLSQGSDGNLIKHTTELSNGDTLDTAHMSFGINEGKYFHLFSALPTTMKHERFSHKARKSDNIIDLGYFDARFGNFVWSIVVSAPNRDVPDIPEANVRYVDFDNFRVSVIWSFIGISSTSSGVKFHMMTSPPRLNRAEDDSNFAQVNSAYGRVAEDLATYLSASLAGTFTQAQLYAQRAYPWLDMGAMQSKGLRSFPYDA